MENIKKEKNKDQMFNNN